MSDAYCLFAVMAIVTVASPGPGVLMTLDNAVAGGWQAAMQGVLGLAVGAAAMAGLSSAGVGLLIRSSPALFLLLNYAGVAYLFYLAINAWQRSPPPPGAARGDAGGGARKRLLNGALLQTSNPKSLLFFVSALPQVARGTADTAEQSMQLVLAVATYCGVLILVHGLYASLATQARTWLSQPGAARLLSRLSAVMFLVFGVMML